MFYLLDLPVNAYAVPLSIVETQVVRVEFSVQRSAPEINTEHQLTAT